MTAPRLELRVEKSLYPIPWQRLVLEPGSYMIGRSPYSHILIPDLLVSRRHARVFYAGGKWYIEDLGSRNGTILDGSNIQDKGPVALDDSREHEVIIGSTLLKVKVLKEAEGGPEGPVEQEGLGKKT